MRITIVFCLDGSRPSPHELLRTSTAGDGWDLLNSSGLVFRRALRFPRAPFKIEDKADVAQLVEQPIRNRQVSGSSPLVGSSIHAGSKHSDDSEPVFDPTILFHLSLTCRFLFKQSRAFRERHVVYIPSAALIRTLFAARRASVVEAQ
jgi:hypothetical protein